MGKRAGIAGHGGGRGEMVDATDLGRHLSALRETGDAELLKFGEPFRMATPSQAPL
jgi:hypothetical protein